MEPWMMLMQPLMMGLTTAVSAVAGWFAARWKAAKSEKAENAELAAATREACVLLMGARLDTLCEQYEAHERHTAEQTQHLVDECQLYQRCGGDGVRTSRVERVTGLSLETDMEVSAR